MESIDVPPVRFPAGGGSAITTKDRAYAATWDKGGTSTAISTIGTVLPARRDVRMEIAPTARHAVSAFDTGIATTLLTQVNLSFAVV
jgi:hypothetical protein